MEARNRNPGADERPHTSAEWYDRSINWAARLSREIPVLCKVLGPPGGGGVLDAGCGTGHQARAMAERGYRVVGADISTEMLDVARHLTGGRDRGPHFVAVPYAKLHKQVGGGFDGVYCLANALAAAGTRDAVAEAISQFAKCLRPGGRLFAQMLNFVPMRREEPCVRGPRIATVGDREYVSVRQFSFFPDHIQVSNITLWHDGGWHQRAQSRCLYGLRVDELRDFCGAAGLEIDHLWGSYACEPFDERQSVDLLIAATRVS